MPWEMYEISRVYTRETGNSCGTASFNLTRYIRAARWFNACSNALIYRQPVRLRKIEFPRSCAALIFASTVTMKAARGLYSRRFWRSNSRWKISLLVLLTLTLRIYSETQNVSHLSHVSILFPWIFQQINIGRAKLAANCWMRIDRGWNASSRCQRSFYAHTEYDTTRAIFRSSKKVGFRVVRMKIFSTLKVYAKVVRVRFCMFA